MSDTSAENGEQVVRAGFGSVEIGIEGRYDLSISAILDEAWKKIDGNKGTVWLAWICMVVILVAFSAIVQVLLMRFGVGHVEGNPVMTNLLVSSIGKFLGLFVSVPLGAGFTMLGIKMAVNAPVKWDELFNYFEKVLVLIGTTLLMYLLIAIGFCLLVLPGIYLAFAYSLAIPLVVEKNLSPWEALETSRKAITHNWFKLFGLYFLFGLIVLISAIPIGIGLIWTVPMSALLIGVVYRTIFGYEREADLPKFAE